MGRAKNTSAISSLDRAAGQDAHMGQILASAMRHSVGRLAMSMGRGSPPMERLVSRRLILS